jgi:hypothetical protein
LTQQPPSNFKLRVETGQTWILVDVAAGTDVGGITYRHSRHGLHYQPWLLIDGARVEFSEPAPQLGQAAEILKSKVLRRSQM